MDLVPTQYRHVPRGGRSAGSVEFTFPLLELLEDFISRFATKTLQRLKRGKSIPDEREFLDRFTLGPDVFDGSAFADGLGPAAASWDCSWLGLEDLIANATNHIRDDGAWRDQADGLKDAVEESASEFASNLTEAVFTSTSRFGIRASAALLTILRTQCSGTIRQLEHGATASDEPIVRSTQNAVSDVERLLRRKSLRMRLAERFGQWRWRGAWNLRQRKKISSLVDNLNRLQTARFSMLQRRARLDLLKVLLEHIKAAQRRLKEARGGFETLMAAIAGTEAGEVQFSATRVPVIQTLECEIDSETGRTVFEEFLSRARLADRSPADLSKRLSSEGLKVRDERLLPYQWGEIDTVDLAERLLRCTRRYLGADDLDRSLEIDDPRTAVDFCAQLSLCHPLIKPHLIRAMVNEVYRAAPYAEFDRLQGIPVNIQTFLYCYPADREELVSVFSRQTRIAERNNGEAYATAHPYSMALVRCRIAAPIGAMPALRRWALLACDSKRNQRVTPIEAEARMNEVLLFPKRVRCNLDSTGLLDAAIKAGIVATVGKSGHLALTKDDPRFTALFSPPLWKITRVPASQIHDLIRDGDELPPLLIRQFPDKPGLRALLARLSRETDAEAVADELVAEGVLVKHGVRYALHNKLPVKPQRAPRELVRPEPGPLVGISRDAFISRLYSDDLLYTVLFFSVMRAWRLEHISENDVPASITAEAARIIG